MLKILSRINNAAINNLSARDKRHIWIILAAIAAITIGGKAAGIIWRPETPESVAQWCSPATLARLSELDSIAGIQPESDTLTGLDAYILRRYDTIALFEFDPNSISKEGLLRLGLTDKQASALVKYRAKGGKFSTPADLSKLYGMRAMQFQILEPYIKIAGAPGNKKHDWKNEAREHDFPEPRPEAGDEGCFFFDPNSISEEDFQRLGFTGEQARQFAAYRKKGKKFYVPIDITDAYCVDTKAFARIKDYIRINIDSLTGGGKIRDLNTIDLQGLSECGLSAEEAGKILDFRSQAGFFYAPWQIGDCIGSKRGNKLKEKFYVCRSVERRLINVNEADAQEMAANPYFSDIQASAIVQLRGGKGRLKAADLVEQGVFSDKEMKRVANYICF